MAMSPTAIIMFTMAQNGIYNTAAPAKCGPNARFGDVVAVVVLSLFRQSGLPYLLSTQRRSALPELDRLFAKTAR